MVAEIRKFDSEDQKEQDKRRVTFLDTGEHYIISFESEQDPAKLADMVAKLYDCLGISLTFDPTDMMVSTGQIELILDTVGRVFAEDSFGCRCDLSKLKTDIAKIVDFYDVRNKGSKFDKVAPADLSSSTLEISKPLSKSPISGRDPVAANDSDLEGKGFCALDECYVNLVSSLSMMPQVHILYNSLISMSIVFEDVINEDGAEDLCRQYPDFELVRKFPRPADETRKLCSSLFHKKAIERADLDVKVDSFIKLFELESSIKGADDSERLARTTLDDLRRILDSHFVVNDDPNVTMRANEVIYQVSNKMRSFCHVNIRRLPGLLIECGLKKKRLRNGNHYYGIRVKTEADFPGVDSSMKHLEQQRMKDVEDLEQRRKKDVKDVEQQRMRDFELDQQRN